MTLLVSWTNHWIMWWCFVSITKCFYAISFKPDKVKLSDSWVWWIRENTAFGACGKHSCVDLMLNNHVFLLFTVINPFQFLKFITLNSFLNHICLLSNAWMSSYPISWWQTVTSKKQASSMFQMWQKRLFWHGLNFLEINLKLKLSSTNYELVM